MGCFNTKNITTEKPHEEKMKELNKVKGSSGASAGKSKDLVTSKTGFNINSSDLVGEKSGNINLSYNLLMPPLGKGTFGEVRKAIHKETGMIRAVKMILKTSTSPEEKERLLNEVNILKSLDHPNILKVYEFFVDEKYFYIVSELCLGGELFDKIVEVKSFDEYNAVEIMNQLLSSVAYCHAHSIVHRDLKPENLLLESKKEGAPIKVIDFGTSRQFNPSIKMNQKFGTVLYMAPEVLRGKYDQKCDIWSCGVICYILLCGYPPFNDRNDQIIIEKIKKGDFEFPQEEWGSISSEAKDFVRKLLTMEPENRPSATDALKHPWILKRRKTDSLNNPQSQKALLNLKTFRADRKIQQATWVYLVSYLSTREEKNELMKTFKALDLNGDGQLSRDELIAGYEKIMGTREAEREVDNIMATVDTNKSGFIDYSEFVTASINRQKLLSKERLEMAFKLFDKDGSGYISSEELKEMFSGGQKIEEGVWNELIKEVDQNGDGQISFVEFKEMMMKLGN